MAHSHSHNHHDAAYYVEQLCTLGICSLLGGITVMLYYQDLLRFILAPKFYQPVLWGGITLLALVVIRAISLWAATGKSVANNHDHAHGHGDCAHDDCGHEHEHAHGHDHGHEHAPAHAHDHEHDHGHDHGWNPWRYTVLLLPVVLYFLNLPNAGFGATKVNTGDIDQDTPGRFVENTGLKIMRNDARDGIEVLKVARDSAGEKSGVKPRDFILRISPDKGETKQLSTKGLSIEDAVKALGGPPGSKVGLTVLHEGDDKPQDLELVRAQDILAVGFKELEQASFNPGTRQFFEGRTVRLVGQYAPGNDDRTFGLVRFKMTCCAADAIQLNVVIMLDPNCKENLTGLNRNDWLQVTGRVQFRKRRDRDEYVTVLIVNSPKDVQQTKADDNPYLQT
jgi:hypothetical protein